MKKALVIFSCLVLVLSLSVLSVSAAADGYDFVSSAVQVVVNGSIVGEGVVIITESDNIPTANLKWAVSVVLDATETEGVYSVAFVHVGDGNDPAITLEEGQILLGVHSATSDPAQIDQYQNVNGKNAATALEQGDTVTFTGVDLEAGTVAADATIIAGGNANVDESAPADESTPADESVPADDESAPADDESAPANTSDAVSESGENEGGNNTWIYIVCAVAAVVIVAVVVVMVKKK